MSGIPVSTRNEHGAEQEGATPAGFFAWYAEGFSDQLGDRLLLFDNHGETLELLRLRNDVSQAATFEFALRERVQDLRDFADPDYPKVLRVERLAESGGSLAVASVHASGHRLSQVLAATTERGHMLQAELAVALTRQLLSAVARFHAWRPDVSHGALTMSRLVLAGSGQLVVTEYVLASALRHLRLGRKQLWCDLRVPVPPQPVSPQFDQAGDVVQIAVIALSLLLNRELTEDEYLSGLDDVLQCGPAIVTRAGRRPLSPPMVDWFRRALQLDGRVWFASAVPALLAFDQAVAEVPDQRLLASSAALETPAKPTAMDLFGAEDVAVPSPVFGAEDVAVPSPVAPPPQAVVKTSTDIALHPHPSVPALPDVPAVPLITSNRALRPLIVIALVVMTGVAAVAALVVGRPGAGGEVENSGSVRIESEPPGAEVFIAGSRRGTTPLNLLMSPGSHAVELRSGPRQRTIAVTLAAGARVSHFVELSGAGRTGRIEVRSEPAGAEVSVDGKVHGRTPLVIGNVAPGPHSVRLASEQGALEQTVTLEPGGTASVVAPLSGLQPASGWVSFASPEELQIFQNGALLGTTARARIPLRAGRHTLQFVNEALGFRAVRAVDVRGGRLQQIPVALPMGTLDVNATPWAEVWVDGRRMGETPIGNLPLRIGRHHVTFKHPELGERRRDATITLAGPTRLSVNLRQ